MSQMSLINDVAECPKESKIIKETLQGLMYYSVTFSIYCAHGNVAYVEIPFTNCIVIVTKL